jgi:hypothetical protein
MQLSLLLPPEPNPQNYDVTVIATLGAGSGMRVEALRTSVGAAVASQAGYRLRFSGLTPRFDHDPGSGLVDFRVTGDAASAEAAAAEAFDLSDGPLVRCTALAPRDEVVDFRITASHVVLDGTAQNLLLADIADALAGQRLPGCDEATYRVRAAEAVRAERDSAHRFRAELPDHLREWDLVRPGLAGFPDPGPADPVRRRRPEVAIRGLGTGPTGLFRGRAAALGVTRADLCLTAISVVLSDLVPARRHVVRLVADVRPRGVPPVAGCFINAVPMVLESGAAPEHRPVAVSRAKKAAMARRQLPFPDYCGRLAGHDPGATALLGAAPIVTIRRAPGLPFPGDLDYTVPPIWPKAALLLRFLLYDDDIVVDVETDDRLPAALGAARIAAGLVAALGRVADAEEASSGARD